MKAMYTLGLDCHILLPKLSHMFFKRYGKDESQYICGLQGDTKGYLFYFKAIIDGVDGEFSYFIQTEIMKKTYDANKISWKNHVRKCGWDEYQNMVTAKQKFEKAFHRRDGI